MMVLRAGVSQTSNLRRRFSTYSRTLTTLRYCMRNLHFSVYVRLYFNNDCYFQKGFTLYKMVNHNSPSEDRTTTYCVSVGRRRRTHEDDTPR